MSTVNFLMSLGLGVVAILSFAVGALVGYAIRGDS